jgi:hypothetical protein
LALSGLSSTDSLLDRIQTEKTDPKSFSVNVKSLITTRKGPLIVCHTSGTSGGSISDVKWFHMTRTLVERLWAPGMKAIFEASGLTSQKSAIIFVPSRAKFDGLFTSGRTRVIKLYSAEFSQRLVLSLLHPYSYLLHPYKDSRSVKVLAEIMSMDRIAVVSAPFLTLLGWADPKRLRYGLEKSLNSSSSDDDSLEVKLTKRIERIGLKAAAKEIQEQLSELLSDATLIFSATAMTEKEWNTICTFLQWERGEEQVTNLYVGSEVGPFAASIGSHSWKEMSVFPLTIPVIEHKKERHLISKSPHNTGKLLLSRMQNGDSLINIDTGDVITVANQEGLPLIKGEILRAGFPLKPEIRFSSEVRVPESYNVFVGSYFDMDGIHITNPRLLVLCLAELCNFDRESSLILKKDSKWILMVPFQAETCSRTAVLDSLSLCPHGTQLEQAVTDGILHIEQISENPVESAVPRSVLLNRVRMGELPKGVLTRWPLYVVVPAHRETEFV